MSRRTNPADIAAVTETVRTYYDGGMMAGDEAKLASAFHPRASIVGNEQGELYWATLDEFVADCKHAVAQAGPYEWRESLCRSRCHSKAQDVAQEVSADYVAKSRSPPSARLGDGEDRVARRAVGSQHDGVVSRPVGGRFEWAGVAAAFLRPGPADSAIGRRCRGEQPPDRCRQGRVHDKAWPIGARGWVGRLGDALGHAVDPDLHALAPRRSPRDRLGDLPKLSVVDRARLLVERHPGGLG